MKLESIEKAKICLVVVTYNRKELLKENLNSLINQNIKCDILVVDNNSNDGTDSLVKDFQKEYSNIIYIKLDENVGGAGGFYNGVSKAYELKYDFVVLMDDDGHPINNNTIRNLIELYYKEDNKKVMINSIVYSDYNTKTLSFGMLGANNLEELKEKIKDGKIEGAINPFNGTLLTKELIKDIGYPKKEFFISGDETEYTLRARKNGYKIMTAVSSEYYHPSAKYKIKKVFGKEIKMRSSISIWRRYYYARNYSFINKKYYRVGRQIKNIIKQLLESIFLVEKPLIAIKYTLLGIIDGYREKFVNDKHINEKLQKKC